MWAILEPEHDKIYIQHIRAVWSEISMHAWRSFGSLAAHIVPSEDWTDCAAAHSLSGWSGTAAQAGQALIAFCCHSCSWLTSELCFLLGNPESPTNLTVTNVTAKTVTLQWNSGFDWASPQYFQVYLYHENDPVFPIKVLLFIVGRLIHRG